MFQLRGDVDQWSEAASGEVVDMNPGNTVGDKIKAFFTSAPIVSMATTAPTPTTTVKTVTVAPKPWYKTPIGILGILAAAFVTWKYIVPAIRKK